MPFFNDARNELVWQFIDVVSSYELICIEIYGIVSDGGRGNTKFFHMISEYKPLKAKWIDDKCLSTVDPVEPSR